MPEKLRVGIVGCGDIAQARHIPEFEKLKNSVVLQAVSDRDYTLAKETADRYRIPRAYPDISEMLSAESLDIIDICTPPRTHASLAVEALQHGCHVLTEKPMAHKVSDCDQMIEAAQRHKVKLGVIHNNLFDPPFLKAKKLVAAGAIGDFIGMRIFMSDPRDEMIMKKDHWIHKLPGGIIGETLPHAAYMSLAFLNRVKNVDIYAKNFLGHPWAPFDEFRIELEGEKAMSSILISYSSNYRNLLVDIMGTEGLLHLDFKNMLLVQHLKKESGGAISSLLYFLNTTSQEVRGITANAFKLITGKLKFGHGILIESFVDSILNEEQPPVTGEDGREAIKVVEMVVEKLQQKYGTY